MLKIINIIIFFLVTAFFFKSFGQNNTLLVENRSDSISISGIFQNRAVTDQFYYFLPIALAEKTGVVSKIHLASGISSFYFNDNGIRSFHSPGVSFEEKKNGQLVLTTYDKETVKLFSFSIRKEPFNGFYGHLNAGYLVHGLVPFNSEADLLNLDYSRSDYNFIEPQHTSPDSIHRVNSHVFIFLSSAATIENSGEVFIVATKDVSSPRINYIKDLTKEALTIWNRDFHLSAPPAFTVILDEKAGVRSPYLKNGVVLDANMPRKSLSFEILLELSKSLILAKNPKTNKEDLLKTALALILHYYDETSLETSKSDLFFKLIAYQQSINRDIVASGKRQDRLDTDMIILQGLKDISSISLMDREDLIRSNLQQQYFPIKKRKHNERLISSQYPGNPFKSFLYQIINPQDEQIVFAPLLGYNFYDNIMPGGILRWRRHLSADIIPLYSFSNKTLNGIYHIKKEIILDNKSPFRSIIPQISFRNFSFRDFTNNPFVLQYKRFSAGADLHFSSERNNFSGFQEFLQFKYIRILEENLIFSTGNELMTTNIPFTLLRLNYTHSHERSVNPYRFATGIEYGNYETPVGRQQYIKLEGIYENAYTYRPGKKVFYRFYAGFFPYNTQENSSNLNNILTRGSLSIFNRGFADYGYDELLLKRGNEGLLAQQIFGGRGHFKIPAGSFFTYGQSNKFIFSANFMPDLPFTGKYFPVKPFVDVAYVMDGTPLGSTGNDEYYYTAGLAMEWGKHFGLYYPFFYSRQIGIILAENGDLDKPFLNYLSRLSFRVDLMQLLNLKKPGQF